MILVKKGSEGGSVIVGTTQRMAILVYVVLHTQEKVKTVGHTLVQKLFYLLQSGKGVPLGYKFRLYHYGPYCSELWGDLNSLGEYGYLTISANEAGFGYEITVTPEGREFLSRFDEFEEIQEKVHELVEILGGQPVRRLEALATAHFIYQDGRKQGRLTTEDEVVSGVLKLKPHLKEEEVRDAFRQIERLL